MADLVSELNSLDFSVYIGGPLQAAVQAQQASSMATVSFIQEVGFETDSMGAESLRYVDFKYQKSTPNPNFGNTDPDLPSGANTTDQFLSEDVVIKVPFLTMLVVPSLRVDEVTIDFNARLTSTETKNVSSEFAASAELGIEYKKINFKASASYKRTSNRGEKVERSYNLGVHVKAVQDEIPQGLDRILTMLEDSIVAV